MTRLHELNLVWNVTPNWYICWWSVVSLALFLFRLCKSFDQWLLLVRNVSEERIWCKKIFSLLLDYWNLLTSLNSPKDENISQKIFVWTIPMSILYCKILKILFDFHKKVFQFTGHFWLKKIISFFRKFLNFVTKIRCEKVLHCKSKVDSLLWLRENGCFFGCSGQFGLVINSKSN